MFLDSDSNQLLNQSNTWNQTPLSLDKDMHPYLISPFLMAREGDWDKLGIWLDKNPFLINIQTYKEKKTLLMIAVKHCWDVIVKILLQRGADMKIQNFEG